MMGEFNDRIRARERAGKIIAGIHLGHNLDLGVRGGAGDDGLPHAALRAIDQEAQRRDVAISQSYLTRLRLRSVAISFAALAGAISHSGRRNSPETRPARLTAVLIGMGLVSRVKSRKSG